MELRGTRRDDRLHAGRTFAALRDLRVAGLRWTFEGGDIYASPAIGEYRFTNLYTPAVTFSGGALSARGERTALSFAGGRATAWRNIFGTDPETLDQTLASGRFTHRFSSTFDVNVRASRTRTTDLGEYIHTVDASDQAGGGVRYALTPELQLVADGSFVAYRRAGASEGQQDGSGLVGASWLHGRGWLQMNAFRFSPGETPTINSPLGDREGIFAAGEYDLLPRLRVFAGGEVFRSNLDGYSGLDGRAAIPRTSGVRSFGGVRLTVGSRSTLTLRVEDGDRLSRPVLGGIDSESDTGSWSAEWQTAAGRFTGTTRYARRDNVERARTEGSYTQHDASAQVFVGLSRASQLFGMGTVTLTEQALSRNTYWQAGGGGQLQLFGRGLWMRGEGQVSRNVDQLLELYVPRESLNLGVNGSLTPLTTVGVSVYLDRAPVTSPASTPWVTRSMFRVTRSMKTGTPEMPGRLLPGAAALERGTGAVRGVVYADWNANGTRDEDEPPLAGIPLIVREAGTGSSRKDGAFTFAHVPVGLREVALDMASLPIDFDPPTIPKVLLDVAKGRASEVSFGLVPLGAIRGRVVRDLDANGRADPEDESINEAVLVLDEGMRSERVREGRFAFEAVRSGAHRLRLLPESLPDGSVISGDAEQIVRVGRERLEPETVFLVSIERRPEIRRVFPGVRTAAPAARNRPASGRAGSAASKPPAARPAAALSARAATPAPAPSGGFTIQIAALDDPLRAASLVEDLQRRGYLAYLIKPPASDPDAPFRVRIGRYASRAEADRAAGALERVAGGKVWIVRDGVSGR
jgi:cell division septation protein DedD